jgi:hypothetical protein
MSYSYELIKNYDKNYRDYYIQRKEYENQNNLEMIGNNFKNSHPTKEKLSIIKNIKGSNNNNTNKDLDYNYEGSYVQKYLSNNNINPNNENITYNHNKIIDKEQILESIFKSERIDDLEKKYKSNEDNIIREETNEYSTVKSKAKQPDSISIMATEENPILSSNFSFEKCVKRSNSAKFMYQNNELQAKENYLNIIDYSQLNRSKYSNNTSYINHYLDRRHIQEMERVDKMKFEKSKNELTEIRDRPLISQKSKEILERVSYTQQPVFDRLTSKAQVLFYLLIYLNYSV